MDLDTAQYRELFIEEAREHIDTLTKSLLILEKEPDNMEALNTLFRSAHTLKGSSGMMGFKDFQELTHAMEDVFDGMRRGNKPTSNLINIILECIDALSSRLENIKNNVEETINVETLIGKLHAATQCFAPKTTEENSSIVTPDNNNSVILEDADLDAVKKAEALGERCYLIDLMFSKDCAFKTVRANMVVDKITSLAEIIRTFPSLKELDEAKLNGGFKLVVTSKFNAQELENCTNQICEIEKVTVFPYVLIAANKDAKSCAQSSEEAKILAETRAAQTVRVRFDHLDKLMNWVGELVINKIALLQVTADNKDNSLKRIIENIDRLTADLQDLVMQVRMVPVSQIFDRFPRLVRDLSLKKGKKIDLIMEGREIEVDRTVLDEIGEPLIHLLRNSIDHGIEPVEERLRAQKNPTGRIRLSAQRSGDHVIIEVEDDGAGIDPAKIAKAAVRKGFATEAEVQEMSKDQLINMIFLPGFSTASEVTDTSGRGVGMDVVKTKITALGGTVHLDTHVGKGTKISIKLPLTLAIIQAILVNDSGQTFAIPVSQVSEIVRAKKSEIRSLGKTDAIVVRDHVIPVVHLHKLLRLPGANEEDLELLIIYLGGEEEKLGLAVDSVIRQQDILVKALNGVLSGIKGISGATILGDGQLVLVLDMPQLVKQVAH
ncbi:MAG: chemotaxis protein CheA [Candidatus Bathyarchaeia archaeon]